MTHAEALSTGQNGAIRFGKPWRVWRMPAWGAGIFGVRAVDAGFPTEAELFETLYPTGAVAAQPTLFDAPAEEEEDIESWSI